MKTIENIISEAIKKRDLNDAVYFVQTFLGVEDGFNASIFFSHYEDEDWDNAEPLNRSNKLADYIMYEIANINFKL